MRRRIFLQRGTLAALCLAGSACTPAKTSEALKKMGQIAANPDLPIGPPKDQPSMATITLYAEPGANRTELGDAPVDVWIFELSGDDALMQADFLNLSEDPKGALGVSYVRHQTKQLRPGESEVLPPVQFKEDTAFVGVAVGFANLDNATWRAVEQVKPKGENYTIVVPVRKNSVAVQVHR